MFEKLRHSKYKRVAEHFAFWAGYYLLLVYLLGKSDGFFGRVFIGEAIQLPAKIAATYILFAFIEKQAKQKPYLLVVAVVIVGVIVAAFINRSLMYYWIRPTWFQDYYMFFWDEYRITLDITDVGIPVTGAIMLRMLRARLSNRREEEVLRREKTEAELQLLRSQVNPHFLFNTLNSLYALARSNSQQTADAVMRLSNILRFAVYESSGIQIELAKELALIRDYIALEKLRYAEGRVEIRLHESIVDSNVRIAPMLLLPLVENAFKHGVSQLREKSFIEIDIHLAEDVVDMRVSNSYDTNNHTVSLPHQGGVGLQNVQKQLALLYPGSSSLSIQPDGSVFRVHLHVHLRDFRSTSYLS